MNYEEILAAMRARYRELSGFDADQASDIGIRLKVLAAETASVYENISELYRETFPQTSTGKYLELHAQTRAITRKSAIPARGILQFSREFPASSDITIPAGTICATRPEPQVHFETSQAAVLLAGESRVYIPAIAVDAGSVGNVAAGTICVMISPAAGITSVVNPAAFSGGVDEETDDALRSRLLAAYQNISNGTNSAFYYDLAMSHEGVDSANILPRRRGRGTVDVAISCRSDAMQAQIVEAISKDLTRRKEINVDVLVTAAVRDYPLISAEIAVKDGYSFALVAEKGRRAIENYAEELGVGEGLLLATLGSRLLAVDGVYNYRIITPVKDILTASDHVLRPGTITITGMAVG